MNLKGIIVKNAKILLLGITFKENCPDIRNTKVIDIFHTLQEYTDNITIYDPWANHDTVRHEYGVELTDKSIDELKGQFSAVILCVAHNQFKDINIQDFLTKPEDGVIYDVKGVLPRDIIDTRL